MTCRRIGLLVLFAGCDDHLFPSGGGLAVEGYAPTWEGVQDMMGDAGCTGCHGTLEPLMPESVEDDVVLDLGELVVPGEPENSLLWRVLSYEEGLVGMPPTGPLDHAQIVHVEQWIIDGASLD